MPRKKKTDVNAPAVVTTTPGAEPLTAIGNDGDVAAGAVGLDLPDGAELLNESCARCGVSAVVVAGGRRVCTYCGAGK